jgi:hypothetical protein
VSRRSAKPLHVSVLSFVWWFCFCVFFLFFLFFFFPFFFCLSVPDLVLSQIWPLMSCTGHVSMNCVAVERAGMGFLFGFFAFFFFVCFFFSFVCF